MFDCKEWKDVRENYGISLKKLGTWPFLPIRAGDKDGTAEGECINRGSEKGFTIEDERLDPQRVMHSK